MDWNDFTKDVSHRADIIAKQNHVKQRREEWWAAFMWRQKVKDYA